MAAPWCSAHQRPSSGGKEAGQHLKGPTSFSQAGIESLIVFMAEGALRFEHHAPGQNKEGKQASVLPSGPLRCVVGSEPSKIPWEF